jgi:hypothetical protein
LRSGLCLRFDLGRFFSASAGQHNDREQDRAKCAYSKNHANLLEKVMDDLFDGYLLNIFILNDMRKQTLRPDAQAAHQ